MARRADVSDLRDFAHDLRAAGHADLVRDLLRDLRTGAKQVTVETRRAALANLPRRGGLALRVSKAPQRITARAGNTTATVAVVVPGKKKGNAAVQTDQGFVRHPVFGRVDASGKRVFVRQQTRGAGWFSRTAEFVEPDVLRELDKTMDAAARRAGFR